MHDALLAEQSRTNQLLETLVELQGGTVPAPKPQQRPGFDGLMFDDSGQVIKPTPESLHETTPTKSPSEAGPMFDDSGQVIGDP
jgi:hypothetical protein